MKPRSLWQITFDFSTALECRKLGLFSGPHDISAGFALDFRVGRQGARRRYRLSCRPKARERAEALHEIFAELAGLSQERGPRTRSRNWAARARGICLQPRGVR